MEVHHHPHIEKKSFKEYFFEGLMIFLAVSMGFIAENIRENINNTEHAKILTEQLVKDLIIDTVNINRIIDNSITYQKRIDTLFDELQKNRDKVNTKLLQNLVFDSYHISLFNPSSASTTAIEKELNIKQFSSSNLPKMLTNYKNSISLIKSIEDLNIRVIEKNVEPFIYAHISPQNAFSVFRNEKLADDPSIRNLNHDNMTGFSVKIELM